MVFGFLVLQGNHENMGFWQYQRSGKLTSTCLASSLSRTLSCAIGSVLSIDVSKTPKLQKSNLAYDPGKGALIATSINFKKQGNTLEMLLELMGPRPP